MADVGDDPQLSLGDDGSERSKPSRQATLYEIPIGTKRDTCRAPECQKPIYWVKMVSGKTAPLDAAVEGGAEPSATTVGRGLIHFITCVKADRFHHRRPPRRQKSQREMPVDHRAPHCLSCGCSADKPCETPFAEFDEQRQRHIREVYQLNGVSEPPALIPCTLFTIKPPYCTAPACMKVFDSLPTNQRLKAVRSMLSKQPKKKAS